MYAYIIYFRTCSHERIAEALLILDDLISQGWKTDLNYVYPLTQKKNV